MHGLVGLLGVGREVHILLSADSLGPVSSESFSPHERGSGTKRGTANTDLNKSRTPRSLPRAHHRDLLTPVLGVMTRLFARGT